MASPTTLTEIKSRAVRSRSSEHRIFHDLQTLLTSVSLHFSSYFAAFFQRTLQDASARYWMSVLA